MGGQCAVLPADKCCLSRLPVEHLVGVSSDVQRRHADAPSRRDCAGVWHWRSVSARERPAASRVSSLRRLQRLYTLRLLQLVVVQRDVRAWPALAHALCAAAGDLRLRQVLHHSQRNAKLQRHPVSC